MTTDLWMLLAAAGLQWVLIMTTAMPQLLGNGMSWGLGNRESGPEPAGWVGRADRASKNLQENLPLFAILVLVAHVTHSADTLTAAGSAVFLVGRLAHAGIYIAGVPGLRTVAWAVSIVGMLLVAWAIAT